MMVVISRTILCNAISRLLAIAMSVVLISGCSLPIRVEEHARKTNEIAWQVQHEMILLNILRARDHEPMLFTSLNLIRGSVKYSAGTGAIPIPFGGDSSNYGINPTATIESNPTFDVSILDNEEFYRGILKPVSVQTIQLYLNQGWPAYLLYLLAIESYPGCAGTSTCANNPDNESQFSEFAEYLKKLIDCEDRYCIEIVKGKSTTATVAATALQNFNLYEAMSGGFKVELDVHTGLYTITKPGGLALKGPRYGVTLKDDDVIELLVIDGELVLDSPTAQFAHLRSPQGMIYYLGESLRPDSNPIRIEPTADPLLVVRCSKDLDKRTLAISVNHKEQVCGIPKNNSRESLRTISLISQLIGLSKSAENLPTTGAVQVVN